MAQTLSTNLLEERRRQSVLEADIAEAEARKAEAITRKVKAEAEALVAVARADQSAAYSAASVVEWRAKARHTQIKADEAAASSSARMAQTSAQSLSVSEPLATPKEIKAETQEPTDTLSIMFYCSPSHTVLTYPPTRAQYEATGGIFTPNRENGKFVLNNGRTAYSSSGACCASLNRDGATNQWQGPMHTYLRIKDNWVRFNETPFYQPRK